SSQGSVESGGERVHAYPLLSWSFRDLSIMRNQKTMQWVAWVLVGALVLGAIATALSLFFR
ncbi:MAG TPA: hypothetical protein VFZ06_11410, partial [Acidimicrobiia bacterium]|nr:hypothetical protein [Acidimicrobiia bacterium]